MKKSKDAMEIQTIYQPALEYDCEELHVLHMCLITTHRCTLRCKYCVERTPYYSQPYSPPLSELIDQIDAYFKLVDFTLKFDVSGGEPFTRKDLPEILEHLRRYKSKFGRVRVNTNGTILPTPAFITSAKKLGTQFDVLIDKYSDRETLLSKRADELAQLLNENGIRFILRPQSQTALYANGWVDFGNMELMHTDAQACELFEKCAITSKIGYGFRMKNFIMTPCAMVQQLQDFHILMLPQDEIIDLSDQRESIQQKRDKLVRIFNLKLFQACKYCNGICKDSKRYAPAEQLG